jgi:hypothetical protein
LKKIIRRTIQKVIHVLRLPMIADRDAMKNYIIELTITKVPLILVISLRAIKYFRIIPVSSK